MLLSAYVICNIANRFLWQHFTQDLPQQCIRATIASPVHMVSPPNHQLMLFHILGCERCVEHAWVGLVIFCELSRRLRTEILCLGCPTANFCSCDNSNTDWLVYARHVLVFVTVNNQKHVLDCLCKLTCFHRFLGRDRKGMISCKVDLYWQH